MTEVQPPWDMVMNAEAQVWFTVFVMVPWVIFIYVALGRLVKQKDSIPLLFLIGGMCAIVMEPIVDVMGMCFFPVIGQWEGLETFQGRPVPIWMYPVYSWFVGGQAYLLWKSMNEGKVTGQTIWRHWLVGWVVNIILESPGVLFGVYAYYGDQAFNFWGLPLWWPAVNATMPVVAAFIVHMSWHHLLGWKALYIIPLLPIADGLVNGGLAWPTWSALHSGYGFVATYPAAIMTIALAALCIWLLANAMDDSFEKRQA